MTIAGKSDEKLYDASIKRKQGRFKVAIAGLAAFIGQPKEGGCLFGLDVQLGVINLRKIDQFLIIAEHHLDQFGMLVEFERCDDKGIELPCDQVCEVECRDLMFGLSQKAFGARVKRKAMGPGEPIQAFFSTDLIDLALRAAFGVADINALDALCARIGDLSAQACADPGWRVVPNGRQAIEFDMIEPVGFADGQDFARNGTAGDDADFVRPGQRRPPQAEAIWLCLRVMKLLAVSTATAASRQ